MKNLKKTAIFLIKLSVSTILLTYLISMAGPEKIIGLFYQANSFNLIAALLCYVTIIYVSAFRLQLLIPNILPLKSVFAISAIGYFFNMFLPSGISGDVARVYYLKKEINKTKNVHLVDLAAPFVMEKYFGLVSVLVIGLVVLPFALSIFDSSQIANAIVPTIVFLLLVFCLGMIFFKFRFFKNNRFISIFYAYLDSFKDKKRLYAVFLYSAVIQIISIVAIYSISEGMGLGVSFFFFIVIIPIINIITILPVTLGGLGLREGAFVLFMAYQGIPPHAAISLSLMSFLLSLIASLLGLYEYMRYRTKSLG
ncbi:MAG TPA: lysylphosphatidylglycerol synthase transmembrane domain-containing protein [Candidatus Methanoperedens sp.]